MKGLGFLLVMLLGADNLFAQRQDLIVLPQFPNGDSALYEFIKQEVHSPESSEESTARKQVRFRLLFDENGRIINKNLLNDDADPLLTKECERVLDLLPVFSAGTIEGEPSTFDAFIDFNFFYQKSGDKTINKLVTSYLEFPIAVDVHTIAEKMPEHIGGYSQMWDFLASVIEYPKDAKNSGVSGTVYVSFTVDVDGSVISPKVEKGVIESLNQEALRVVRLIKGFRPGTIEGKSVPVKMTIPLRFELDKSGDSNNNRIEGSSITIRSTNRNPHGYYFKRPVEHPYLDEANKAFNEEKFGEAIQFYTKSIEREETESQGYFMRGLVYNKTGEFELAERDFKKAIECTKFTNVAAHMARGNMRMEIGQLDSAIVDFKVVSDSKNERYEANLKLGQCWLEKNELNNAIQYLKLANNARPYNENGHYFLGIAEITSGNYHRAIESFDKLLEVNPKHASGYFNRGMAKARMRELDAACADWIKAKELGYKDAIQLVDNQCSSK
ncbi:MAG: TonB family protein [Flavobacteriales bacterium]|nr:TonB family protein [Flavobacteriales bacterium]